MKPILEIKNVSKKFRIQHNAQPYLSLRESISSFFKSNKASSEDFYALRDVNFDVNPGETIGIIGRNGAGKSTLLKILSKITPPTDGRIVCRGRIASLLEVGTGFHPELTGRENIFFNGSVLGMQRKEILQKFDAIIDFSGVEKFIDTPLKHYSSGMQLRLAFSIAAHLEPEILVIDEVLAVGDAEFQKKCLGKMDDVSKSGRTILLVSHNLGSVKELCRRAICLQQGELVKQGEVGEVIDYYIQQSSLQNVFRRDKREERELQDKAMYIRNVYYTDENKARKIDFSFTEDVYVNFDLEGKNTQGFSLLVNVVSSFNNIVFSAEAKIDSGTMTLKINRRFLTQGSYFISARIHIPAVKLEDKIENSPLFNIVDLDSEWGIYNSNNYFYGSVIGDCQWVKQ